MDRAQKEALLRRLRDDAHTIARAFGLTFAGIEADHPRASSRYGLCYEDGLIRIRLNHVRTGQSLKYSSLVATLCHELAHLRHFDHSPKFHRFNREVLAWARRHAIYRPGSKGDVIRFDPPGKGAKPPATRNGVPVFPSANRSASPPSVEPHTSPAATGDPPPPAGQVAFPFANLPTAPPPTRPRPRRRNNRRKSPEQLKLF